ncbi:undecaprenyl-diphosphatase [Fulvimarina manganoxydans]|uniref:Undecaprenyl-diphosphatase n=1 Tax=Fulvimarina manganoxydans TaxID=937218 RepID=A0A1W2E084_9HYPH|nr:phosphatase PAP2 family protein [Fulvimarina manganoxydans]SMD03150.1 undecaprenyl-diphosphatase [Fulvimarina manganoxydans]
MPESLKRFLRLLTVAARRIESRSLIAILIAAVSIWGFIALAGEVLEGDTKGLDTEILLALRSPADPTDPVGPHWVEEFGRDMTAFGGTGVLILITAVTAIYLGMRGQWRSGWLVVAAIASGFAMSQLLKWGFSRPRPDLVPHGSYVYTASFPSGHAMMSAVTYLTLAILTARVEEKRRVRAYLIAVAALLTILVGISRVYLGVHWPSDVLAGWTLGATWAILWWFIAKWLESRGAVEPQSANDDGGSSDMVSD